jgi:hypothetical protein
MLLHIICTSHQQHLHNLQFVSLLVNGGEERKAIKCNCMGQLLAVSSNCDVLPAAEHITKLRMLEKMQKVCCSRTRLPTNGPGRTT